MDLEEVTLVGGMNLMVHTKKDCDGEWCYIHNPSDHHMREWTQFWRKERQLMERVCAHGFGHPDPDDPQMRETHGVIHGCDGCCSPDYSDAD